MSETTVSVKNKTEKKTCFVIMPISDQDGYESGHFNRVYNHLIKPAILKAGFEPHRADEQSSSNLIILDIIKKIVDSDIVLCDLSAKNPNVLYELGIRQAFDKKTVLIKDNRTEKIFDISGLRTIPYDERLRIDNTQREIDAIGKGLTETYNSTTADVNSLIQLLSISSAKLDNDVEISRDSKIIFNALKNVESKISNLENTYSTANNKNYTTFGGKIISIGDELYIDGVYEGDITDIGFQNNVITRLRNNQIKIVNLNLYSPNQISSEDPLPF